jgi:zinc transport system substrate-binding protein
MPNSGSPPAARPAVGEPLNVFVTSHPLAALARRIGGGAVVVSFPVPAERDPAEWSPPPDVIARYQAADLVLLQGEGHASWIRRATLRPSRLVDTTAGLADRLLPLETDVVHQHGPSGRHSHAGLAFTTWLDPGLAVLQARAVADALARARPSEEAGQKARLGEVEAMLEALERRMEAAWKRLGSGPLVFSHPVYQYLRRRYGLQGHAMHWEADVPPSESEWRALDEWAAGRGVRWMIWEAAPAEATERRLRERGVAVLVFAPGVLAPRKGDWLDEMESNVARLERAAATSD